MNRKNIIAIMRLLLFSAYLVATCTTITAASPELSARKDISLDGRWQIAEGTLSNVPAKFEHEVAVPGLVDMAVPQFAEPGPKGVKDPRRDAFWYRKTFHL